MSLFLLNCYRVQYRMAASTTTKGESYVKREEKLRKEVRAMQQHDDHKVVVDFDPLHLLELIDTLQRLGLSYHLRMKTKELWLRYTIRILIITAIINKNKKDEKRSFKLSCLGDDCKGILAQLEENKEQVL
ncbi:hypothetical protein CUMW_225590 [Citrus unshiu]|uniref:Terpene synthase N-terminal domain-containing protein n=1 Tax=Citrus unshiu TaxID=55188 RepID=A0A2H5QFM7_CITUN|nr:hypothetical protein CUMW_225590 [Citrus unshiu]